MSHWDFSRAADTEHDVPSAAAGSACEPDPPLGADGTRTAQRVRQAEAAQLAQCGWPAGDEVADRPWPAESPWPPGGHWPGCGGWPSHAGGSTRGERPLRGTRDSGIWDASSRDDDAWGGDAWGGDESTGPYPITYERNDFPVTAQRPAEPWDPWPAVPRPDAPQALDFRGASSLAGAAAPAGPGWPAAEPGTAGEVPGWDGADDRGRAGRGGRRWLFVAGIAVAGAAAVLSAGRGPASGAGPGSRPAGAPAAPPRTPAAQATASGSRSAAAAAPLTLGQAQAVVARYTTVNNSANAQRGDVLLATIETGSSYAIDAGFYQSRQGAAPYPAFGTARAAYYIPRGERATWPRWFVVQVANAFSSAPQKVTSSEYLLFIQPAPGGPWLDAAEPRLLSGGDAPRIAVGADGLATAVSLNAASVAVAPAQLPGATAATADGHAAGAGQAAVTVPGNLADVSDQRLWQRKLARGKVTDTHSPAAGTAGEEFALRTADGGALVFYADAAQVTITPPPGSALRLSVPGFYSPGQAAARAGLSYLEQFAAYDPPAGGGTAVTIVADYSGITGKD